MTGRTVACTLAALALLCAGAGTRAEEPVPFSSFFEDKALRLECAFVGDAKSEVITLDRLVQEPFWPGSTAVLLDPFPYGQFAVELYDVATNRKIYSRGFDCMFGEYQTTAPAIEGVRKTFLRSLRIPLPRHPALLVLAKRDQKHVPHPVLTRRIDPADLRILREAGDPRDEVADILKGGEPHSRVDLALLSEGYTAQDREKFLSDARRFAGWLFEVEPYRSLKSRFSIRAVFRPSAERGADEPRQGRFKKTALGASFNALDLDRYLLVEDGRALREMAARVPYDAIVVLVNSPRYGGGGIYNDYCAATVDNERSRGTFLHEFGHAFAGLADEYYLSEVSYNDFYLKGVEPVEPNITAYLSPDLLKWRDLVPPGAVLPTPWGKEEVDALELERRKTKTAREEVVARAKSQGLGEAEVQKIEAEYLKAEQELDLKIAEVLKRYPGVEDAVGLFEGAGYSSKGLYRPQLHCIMGNTSVGQFCRVCQRAIRSVIEANSSP
jgi:hypothetical protein